MSETKKNSLSVSLANIELTENELLVRAVKYASPQGYGKRVKWGVVGALFGLGSTSAHRLCEYAGVDPNEQIENSECNGCPLREDYTG